MKSRTLLSWLALLGGVAIIVAAYIIWRGEAPANILTLNIVVTTFLWCLLFVDILVPWVDWSDASHRTIGSTGVRWFFTWTYIILAVGAIVMCNTVWKASFNLQLIIHCALIVGLVLGIVAVLHTSDKVAEVYAQEKTLRSGVVNIRQAYADMRAAFDDCQEAATAHAVKLEEIGEAVRYMSPSNNPEAIEYERQFSEIARSMPTLLYDYKMNSQVIKSDLDKAARLLKYRHNIYQ